MKILSRCSREITARLLYSTFTNHRVRCCGHPRPRRGERHATVCHHADDERFRVDGPGKHDASVVQPHVPGAVRTPNAQAQARVQNATRRARPKEQVSDGRSLQTAEPREWREYNTLYLRLMGSCNILSSCFLHSYPILYVYMLQSFDFNLLYYRTFYCITCFYILYSKYTLLYTRQPCNAVKTLYTYYMTYSCNI